MESIEFILGPSKYLFNFFVFSFIILIGVISLLPLPLIIKIIISIIVFVYLKKIMTMHALRSEKNSIQRLWQDNNGRWGYFTQEGQSRTCTLMQESFISRGLIILRIKSLKRTSSLLIPVDALTEEENRTLRLRLMLINRNNRTNK